MPVQIEIPDHFESGWYKALLILGIARCRPAWQEPGVPSPIIEHPEPITATVAPILERAATSPYGNLAVVERVELQELFDRAFARIATDYGEPIAQGVYDWVHQVFVSEKGALWAGWAAVFNGAARFAGRERFTTSLLSAGLTDPNRVVDIVERRFGPQVHAERMALVERIREQPASPFEARVRAVDIACKAADPTYPDLYSTLFRALLNHAAQLTWAELDATLADDEREHLLAYAERVTEKLRPLARVLALPERQSRHGRADRAGRSAPE